uniref:Putative t-cell receptor beta chain ana 11 n=1 Tax=Anopheles darlingi TaxID=43151 RepID=A0A2M4CKG5_ANODA
MCVVVCMCVCVCVYFQLLICVFLTECSNNNCYRNWELEVLVCMCEILSILLTIVQSAPFSPSGRRWRRELTVCVCACVEFGCSIEALSFILLLQC